MWGILKIDEFKKDADFNHNIIFFFSIFNFKLEIIIKEQTTSFYYQLIYFKTISESCSGIINQ